MLGVDVRVAEQDDGATRPASNRDVVGRVSSAFSYTPLIRDLNYPSIRAQDAGLSIAPLVTPGQFGEPYGTPDCWLYFHRARSRLLR